MYFNENKLNVFITATYFNNEESEYHKEINHSFDTRQVVGITVHSVVLEIVF